MKLVELLARELAAWPTGLLGNDGITQDRTGEVNTLDSGCTPNFYEGDGVWLASSHSFLEGYKPMKRASDYKTAIVTREMWQAERDRQKGGEWKRHRGGKCPVSADTQVEVKHYDGEVMIRYAHQQDWAHDNPHSPGDIMKYRVISQPQAEEVEVNKFCMGEKCNATSDNILHSSECEAEHEASYTGAWDQIETPFKWRDEVTELNAYIEKYTRERDALIERLASEGFALIPAVVNAGANTNSGIPIDEWQIGDIIRVVSTSDESSAPLGVFTITDIDCEEPKYELDNEYYPNHDQMKFIRRP